MCKMAYSIEIKRIKMDTIEYGKNINEVLKECYFRGFYENFSHQSTQRVLSEREKHALRSNDRDQKAYGNDLERQAKVEAANKILGERGVLTFE